MRYLLFFVVEICVLVSAPVLIMSGPVNPCSGEDAINKNEIILNISGDLTKHNFNSIKFLVTDLVPRCILEDLRNSRDLLDHLQQQPSEFNCLLNELLFIIGRTDLWSRYCNEDKIAVKGDLNNRHTVPLISDYRKLLHNLSDCLDSNDLADLKLLCAETIPVRARQSINSGYALFLTLEKQAVISVRDVKFLKKILEKAHLMKLAQTVEKYQSDAGSSQIGHIGISLTLLKHTHSSGCCSKDPLSQHSRPPPLHVDPDTKDCTTGHGQIDDDLNRASSSAVVRVEMMEDGLRVGLAQTADNLNDKLSFGGGDLAEDGTQITKEQLMKELDQMTKKLKLQSNKDSSMLREYSMTNSPRGHCVIINNMIFMEKTDRIGSEVDCEALETRFKQLNFTVRIERNLNKAEVDELVSKYRHMDHSSYDCFVVCVLSHGKQDHFFCVDEKAFSIQKLMWNFSATNCSSLAGKPKLFFVQASQAISKGTADDDEPHELQNDKIPYFVDMVLAQSTSPGKETFRSKTQGSWFITALCDVLYQCHSELHLTDMLIEVNRRVAEAKVVMSDTICQQCPAPVISLRGAVWFRSNAAVGQTSD